MSRGESTILNWFYLKTIILLGLLTFSSLVISIRRWLSHLVCVCVCVCVRVCIKSWHKTTSREQQSQREIQVLGGQTGWFTGFATLSCIPTYKLVETANSLLTSGITFK